MATREGVMQDVAGYVQPCSEKSTVLKVLRDSALQPSKNNSGLLSFVCDGSNLAVARQEARALLAPAQDAADSGIDSDNSNSEHRNQRRLNQNEDSMDEESDVTVDIDGPIPWNFCAQHPNRSAAEQGPGRVSPSLFEVELTASEEDDASVLELIIPYQKPRYRKLPTSSPLKTSIRAPKYFREFLCCFRK